MAKSSYIIPALAIGASILGFAVASKIINTPRPLPPSPIPLNYTRIDDAFDLSNVVQRFSELAKEGSESRGVLVLGGMSESDAIGVAASVPDLDVIWAPAPIMEESFEIAQWTGSKLLPWTMAVAIPAAGPNAGDAEGEPVTGSFATNAYLLAPTIAYARGGPLQ